MECDVGVMCGAGEDGDVIIMFPRLERTGGPVVSLAKLGQAGGGREGGRVTRHIVLELRHRRLLTVTVTTHHLLHHICLE